MSNSYKELQIVLNDLQQTEKFGMLLGEIVQPGDTLLLSGTLGAGKTTLTQFIAQGLGVPDDFYVTSPSFNLLHEYPGRISLFHIDCYRLDSASDVEDAGLLEYIGTNGVAVIEWPDRLGSFVPSSRLEIFLRSENSGTRIITLLPFGVSWKSRYLQIRERLNCLGLLTEIISEQ